MISDTKNPIHPGQRERVNSPFVSGKFPRSDLPLVWIKLIRAKTDSVPRRGVIIICNRNQYNQLVFQVQKELWQTPSFMNKILSPNCPSLKAPIGQFLVKIWPKYSLNLHFHGKCLRDFRPLLSVNYVALIFLLFSSVVYELVHKVLL